MLCASGNALDHTGVILIIIRLCRLILERTLKITFTKIENALAA
jgi:hypothetical protein